MMRTDNNEPSKIFYALETFGNIFLLNILFLVFSIPVITIGSSLTAMYSVMMKIVRKEEGNVFKGFVEAFKSNFKQATITWLLLLASCVVIYGEFIFAATSVGALSIMYMVILIVEIVLIVFTLPFLFPLIARFDNTIFKTIKNAFLLSVSNFGSWLKISLAWFVPIFTMFRYPSIFFMIWYMWLLLAFGLIAFGTSFTLRKVFDRVEKTQRENEQKKKEEVITKKEKNSKKSISEHLEAFNKNK